MVLGLRSKNKSSTSIRVDYTIHIQDIKPWPPSQSLKTLKSVVLQWETTGDRSATGSTKPVIPSQMKIEFNETFHVHVTLVKESSGKGSSGFQKSALELSLYEPRRDKTAKGQLLGNAVVDLAEYGVVKEVVSFGVPLNCKRSYRNTAQPVVYVKIQPFDKEGSSSSSSFRESLSKESVSALMSGEYAEEAEIASFTDDDVDDDLSSRSSHGILGNAELAVSSSHEDEERTQLEDESAAEKESDSATDLPLAPMPEKPEFDSSTTILAANNTTIHQENSSPQSSPGPTDIESFDHGDTCNSAKNLDRPNENFDNGNTPTSPKKSDRPDESYDNGDMSTSEKNLNKLTTYSRPSFATPHNLHEEIEDKVVEFEDEENSSIEPARTAEFDHKNEMLNPVDIPQPVLNSDDKNSLKFHDEPDEATASENIKQHQDSDLKEKLEVVQPRTTEIECSPNSSPDNGSITSLESMEHIPVVRHKYLRNALKKPANSMSRSLPSDRLKNMRFSMRSPPVSDLEDVKEIDISEDVCNGAIKSPSISSSLGKLKYVSKGNMNNATNEKVRELEFRIEKLEGELREAAALEISLYSVVAEHGSSMHKIHTPARRLSRLYIHASKQWSKERKACAARSAVSGLVLAAKACGNDIPRLTFWLSNLFVLRAIVTRAVGHSDIPNKTRAYSAPDGSQLIVKGKSSPLKWEATIRKKEVFSFSEEFDDWENLSTFTAALERIESWIFSRIVESIWWQTLTPHMQTKIEDDEPKTGSNIKKNLGRNQKLSDKRMANFSIEIWKRAFSDACGRLCPVRSEGHQCGCLSMLARLVMEKCVARLDVAMFNAILRESDDEIPTDPISDPISDPKVLPIPPGKSSFGAGAQLKNAIGNWSRWLTDLLGMDTDDSVQDKNEQGDDRFDVAETFKSFHLLNALSDLLMLPKDMLLEKSIRREVCPTFGTSMIKRILSSFVADEFCPDMIPDEVLEALDFEDPSENIDDSIRHCPCNASPISYTPPSIPSIENVIGDVQSKTVLNRNGSSVIRKFHTSDDELDELDSPLASIILENSSPSTHQLKGNYTASVLRYQLLKDVWRNDD